MTWYIADTSAGDTYFVLAGPDVSKAEFFDHVLRALEDDDPQCAPQELTLHRFNKLEAEHWIGSIHSYPGETWPQFSKRTLIGEITYQYPGEWELKES